MINDVIYNTGPDISGTTRVTSSVEIVTDNPDYTSGIWTGGVDTSDGYVIVSDTTTRALIGRSTGGGTGIAPSNVPTFWKSNGLTDQALIDLVNILPSSLGNFTTVGDARGFLDESGYAVINDFT